MKIMKVLAVPARSGFPVDDQAAIRAGAPSDGFVYIGDPVTHGFRFIRQPNDAVSVMLLLEDRRMAYGDCVTVSYAGAAGRDPVLDAPAAMQQIAEHVAPLLEGTELTSFRELAGAVDHLVVSGKKLHSAVRYGVTQAILDAVAQNRGLTMAEVLREEYNTQSPMLPIPMFAQSGEDRRTNAERMILNQTEVIPHGLINTVDGKLGRHGEILAEYITWLVERIGQISPSVTYNPRLHFDTYGTIGIAMGGDVERVASYLVELEQLASPYQLTIEHPIDAGSAPAQIETYVRLRAALARRCSSVKIVVDEWCNTLEDVQEFVAAAAADVIQVKLPDLGGINNAVEALLLVRSSGMAAYCGGSCSETDRSAQITAHIAMACDAWQVLAKPGMGVDEGLMIVGNEMARTAALFRSRQLDFQQPHAV